MKSNEIRKVANVRPFEPFEMRLVDGDRHVIRHPETIVVGEDLIAALDAKGGIVLIAPDAVVSIRKMRSGGRRR